MTHPLILYQTDQCAEMAAEAVANGATYPTNPRAIAVALLFLGKLRGNADVAEIPLQELITPAALPTWRAILDDPSRREEVVAMLRNHGTSLTRIRPEPDGRVGVLLPWVHPENVENDVQTFSEPRQVFAHMVLLELVNEPDDWRVSGINE
jgi:hypothetical protein